MLRRKKLSHHHEGKEEISTLNDPTVHSFSLTSELLTPGSESNLELLVLNGSFMEEYVKFCSVVYRGTDSGVDLMDLVQSTIKVTSKI